MIRKGDTIRATAAEMQELVRLEGGRPPGKALPVLTQAEVDRLAWDDDDDEPVPEGWEKIVPSDLVRAKKAVSIRLDADLLAWFRDQGPGYQTRINAVLRAFMRSRQPAEKAKPKRRKAA